MIINNTRIIIDKSCKQYQDILTYFVKIEDDVVHHLYELDDDSNIMIDRGLKFLLPDELTKNLRDDSTNDISIEVESDPEYYRNILDGITLRDDQIVTVMKALYHKRGLCQLPTGSGKTICIAAILKYYNKKLGYYPDTIIFEPTNYLVNDMMSRFNEYGIPVSQYREDRFSVEGVVVTHPMSLYNDVQKDKDAFGNIKIFIGDEFHHQPCTTWYSIYNALTGLEVSLGFSASIIHKSKLPIYNLSKLTYEESVIIGCTGPIIINIDPSYYINKGILAKPVLFRMYNPAGEFVYNDRNWNHIRRDRLESDYRNNIICQVVSRFSEMGYKSLILVSTKSHAKSIATKLVDYGTSEKCICSFGGGVYLKLVGDEFESCDDAKNKFDSGHYNIMIGTSHLYEGVDIPNLDSVVLASVGKQPRKLIQGVGRSLRKTKTGNYAYIIDFTDHNCRVLSRHSELRLTYYLDIIGVDSSDIYSNCNFDEFKNILNKLEDG